MDDTVTEEKHMSDLDNESERVSGEESTEDEGGVVTEAATGSDEQPQTEGAVEGSVRKRKPQGPNSPEGT